jgi:hypothetical protein
MNPIETTRSEVQGYAEPVIPSVPTIEGADAGTRFTAKVA